jgi:hypothetical protein
MAARGDPPDTRSLAHPDPPDRRPGHAGELPWLPTSGDRGRRVRRASSAAASNAPFASLDVAGHQIDLSGHAQVGHGPVLADVNGAAGRAGAHPTSVRRRWQGRSASAPSPRPTQPTPGTEQARQQDGRARHEGQVDPPPRAAIAPQVDHPEGPHQASDREQHGNPDAEPNLAVAVAGAQTALPQVPGWSQEVDRPCPSGSWASGAWPPAG